MRARKILMLSLLAGTAFALGAATTPAAEPSAAKPAEPTKEMRDKMAALHEQMAACLRSDKPIADCRGEMMKGCHDLGPTNCPMMGMQRPRHMMQGETPANPK